MSRVAHCIDNGAMQGFWGHPEAGILLQQVLHQQAGSSTDAHMLLQHRKSTTQPGCVDSDGEA